MRIVGETPDESIKETANVADEYSYRRTCTLTKPMIELLVKQMGVELSNHNLYITFANYYKFEGLTKLREYFKRRAKRLASSLGIDYIKINLIRWTVLLNTELVKLV